MQGIPKLNLLNFTQGDAAAKSKFVKELGDAYSDIGFVAIRNHGISEDFLNELYGSVSDFFQLSIDIKLQYDDSLGGGQRGYTGFAKEHAKNRVMGDLKEFWHFGQYINHKDAHAPSYPPNKTVTELPKFNVLGEQLYKSLEETGRVVLRAIALYLELDEDYFDAKIFNGNSILRAIHYPPILQEPVDAIRSGEHEDINLITLLVGASADGLEVLNRKGDYIAVTKVEDHIVVNVGDMLQRLTNDKLRSTTHRVVNPPKEKWDKPRFSIPFFLHPRPETPLNCLESCVNDKNPKKYKDITANEFLVERLTEIGLMK
jgi:isopenicillin N synthase-like dioxygenase